MHPELAKVAERRLGIFTAVEAVRAGYRPDEIRSALSSGRWRRMRRGVYMRADDYARTRGDARLVHIAECVAVLVTLGSGPVISHTSAARVHRLLLPNDVRGEVRLTDADQWRRGRGYVVTRAAVPAERVCRLLGFGVTDPARTLVDCAREWELTDSVVALDAALHDGCVTRTDLQDAVLAASHWVGIGTAARALGLADGRAESPLESRGRLMLHTAGLPRPELQVELHGPRGFVARVDAWFEDAAVAVEFDGRVKYSDPRAGRDPGEVLWLEKRREDLVRELDVRVVRLTQEDVSRRRRESVERLAALVVTPGPAVRRFMAVRTPEPGSPADDTAA
jgi:hypothetical protein